MYREIRVDDASIQEVVIATPLDDYELLDFGHGRKLERNIAVMFMVDMSGSTKGWINDAERKALVLLCESLENLGDRYAIYGFSGMTRKLPLKVSDIYRRLTT